MNSLRSSDPARRLLALLGLALAGGLACVLSSARAVHADGGRGGSGGEGAVRLRVMSFNVRFDNPLDGADAWPRRRELLVRTVEAFGPDLLGTQEVTRTQAQWLRGRLKGYGYVGAGRDDGRQRGEQSGVFYRSDRFALVAQGHLWLSERPDVPGSKGWDAAFPRLVTWARLRDRQSRETLSFFNTHWDHEGERARLESARILRAVLARLPADHPVIVTGDFNCIDGSEPYVRLLRGGRDGGPELIDAYRAVHPDRRVDEGTFHGFKGVRLGARIDWILHSPRLRAVEAGIDRTSEDGRFPSDHFPVTAVLELGR